MGLQRENPVNWFEIPVADIARAKDFYEYVLECQLSLQERKRMKLAEFPMKDGPGLPGRWCRLSVILLNIPGL